MKVLHICQRDDPATGGAVRVAVELVKRLSGSGITARLVFVYGPPGPFGEECPGLCSYLGGHSGRSAFISSLRLFRLIRREMPEVIHHHDGLTWTHITPWIRREGRVVGHAHLNASTKNSTLRNRLAGWVHRHSYERLYCISDSVATSWIQAGYDTHRVKMLPNGVDTAVYYPPTTEDRAMARTRFGISQDATVVTFVGRLDSKMKGCEDFIRIINALPQNFEGVMAGVGPDKVRLERLASKLGLAHRFHFVGMVHPAIPCFHASDLFLMSSNYEPFGLVVLEALSCGLPIVTLPCAGGVEHLTRTIGEQVLSSREPSQVAKIIVNLLGTQTVTTKAAHRHQLACENFSWEKTVASLASDYALLQDQTRG